jgi:phenylacetate-CoA ligase
MNAEQIEVAPWGEVVQQSSEAWQRLAADLTRRSPFYRGKLGNLEQGSAMTVEDLKTLPTTTKVEIRESQESVPPFGEHLGVAPETIKRIYMTSGTSGRAVLIALTRDDLATWTTIGKRTYRCTGLSSRDAVVVALGAGPFVAANAHQVVDELEARRIPVGPGDVERALAAFGSGIADSLVATVSFAIHLAGMVEERGISGTELGLKHLVVGGEPGGGISTIRSRLEETLAARVSEVAGIGDICPSLFGECDQGGGMHFCGQGMVWPELAGPDSDEPLPLEPGARGELLYTTLVREAMPLVRFRSGDMAEVQGPCSCGRSSFRVRIVGRLDDMFIVRGVNVYPSAVQAVVAEFSPEVTGRVRVVLPEGSVSVEPPVPLEVEMGSSLLAPEVLAGQISGAIRTRLNIQSVVELLPQGIFDDSEHKTRTVVRRPS